VNRGPGAAWLELRHQMPSRANVEACRRVALSRHEARRLAARAAAPLGKTPNSDLTRPRLWSRRVACFLWHATQQHHACRWSATYVPGWRWQEPAIRSTRSARTTPTIGRTYGNQDHVCDPICCTFCGLRTPAGSERRKRSHRRARSVVGDEKAYASGKCRQGGRRGILEDAV